MSVTSLIDLHSGNREELLTPHGYYSLRANPEVMEKSYQMLQASGTPIIYQSQDRGNLYHAALGGLWFALASCWSRGETAPVCQRMYWP